MPRLPSLRVYQAAQQLKLEIYRFVSCTPQRLPDTLQLLDSSGSIGSNIAEGYGRGPGKDRIRFYRNARGSAEETIHWLRGWQEIKSLDQRKIWSFINCGGGI